MLFKKHRRLLDESMLTVIEAHSKQEIINYIKNDYPENFIKDIYTDYCAYDKRINWNTYYVSAITNDKDIPKILIGMSNQSIDQMEKENRIVKINESDIQFSDDPYLNFYLCPNCNESDINSGDNYCCNCGVKIEWIESHEKDCQIFI